MKVFENVCVTLFIIGLYSLGFILDCVSNGASSSLMWWCIPVAILLRGTSFAMSIIKGE